MKPYLEYKDSGIEWIGRIPEDWEVKRLKYVTDIQGRIGFKGYKASDLVPEGSGAYTIGAKHIDNKNVINLTSPDFISWEKYYESPEIIVNVGDVIVTQRGTLGKVAIIDEDIGPATINPSIVLLKNISLHNKYLYYIFNAHFILEEINLVNTATAVPMISQSQLSQFIVFSPPLPEQKQIAKYLDHKTAQIDSLIEKKKRLIELLKEERTAVINQVVTKGLDSNVPMKDSGIEWLGEIPAHWDALMIKRLTMVKRGASPRPIDDPKYFHEDGEFAWVRIADVSASERYLTETTQTLSELGASLSVKRYPNDFFLSIAGTVGKPIITKIKCCIHDGFVWFPDLKINPEYFYYIFSTGLPYQGLGKWGTQLNLNTDTVGEIFIPVTTPDDINSIVAYLDKETTRIDTIISKTEKEIELLEEYRTALISEVVTGKIDVREDKI